MADISQAIRDVAPSAPQSASEIDRIAYSRDLWPRHHIGVRHGELPSTRPAVVVWPSSTEEVASIVARCAEIGAPIAPFGAGSGVCGGTLPDARTVILDLKRMNRVRRMSSPDIIDVEAGAMGIRLEEDLVARGHTLGHFPSSILCSTVGGWIAARSAGQCSGLYGKIEDMVVSLECVFGRGEVVRLNRRIQGPDATPLLIGSEGVLGVVTSSELRIHPNPVARGFVAYRFPNIRAGWEAMRDMFQAGLRPAVARLYDAFDSFMARRGAVRSDRAKSTSSHASPGSARKKTLRDAALRLLLRHPSLMNTAIDGIGDRAFGGVTLILVFEGTEDTTREDLARARHVALRGDGRELGEGPARHWFKNRYAVSYRQAPVFMSGSFSDTMEVATTWSRLGELYDAVRRAMHPHVFVMAHLSHAYPDGCSIYFTFAGSASTREEMERLYDATWADAMEATLRAGGTLSHHHGVGRSKAPRLGDEIGLGVHIVRELQSVLDPSRIFNPGNLLPSRAPSRPRNEVELPEARTPRFDQESLLVHSHGDSTLGQLEDLAHGRGLTLAITDLQRDETLRSFVARGGPGSLDPWEDPADHMLAGFTARLLSGDTVRIPPGPRRAVGPDLLSLFWGCEEKVGALTSAFLRVHRTASKARALPAPSIDRAPPFSHGERELIEALWAKTGACRYTS